MTTNPTKVTSEEIAQYREQFADYPESLRALDIIEENDGELQPSASFLASESGIEVFRKESNIIEPNILEKLAQESRNIICDDVFINDLMTGLLSAGVASLTTTGQIPAALATPVVIYLAKAGVKKWCESSKEEPKTP